MFYRISFAVIFLHVKSDRFRSCNAALQKATAIFRSGNIGLRFMLPIVEFGWKDAKFATSFPSMWYKCTVYLTGGVLQM